MAEKRIGSSSAYPSREQAKREITEYIEIIYNRAFKLINSRQVLLEICFATE